MSIRVSFDTVTVEKLTIDDFFEYPAVPMQRNTEGRSKTTAVKKMLKNLKPPHLEVALVELINDCKYYGQKYKKGNRFIVNGNTRKLFWMNNLTDMIPSTVNATIYKVADMEEVREIYNMYDNPSTSEKNQQKVYGIITGLYGYEPKSTKVMKGEIITGLNYASYKLLPSKWNQTTTKAEELPFQIKEFIEEIKTFDEICLNPGRWDQALVCAALMLLKKYGCNNSKARDCLHRIDQRKMDTNPSDYDGVTHICLEWMHPRKFPSKGTSWINSGGFCDTVPFALYWMEKFIKDEPLKQLGGNWQKTADNWFDEYHKNKNQKTVFDCVSD
jgi:hypothetical protein